jgi:DNA-binding transcriptional LysR family regulator
VALGWRPLVDDLLRDGQLAALPVPALTTPRGYWLLAHDGGGKGRAGRRALASLRDWIVRECGGASGI